MKKPRKRCTVVSEETFDKLIKENHGAGLGFFLLPLTGLTKEYCEMICNSTTKEPEVKTKLITTAKFSLYIAYLVMDGHVLTSTLPLFDDPASARSYMTNFKDAIWMTMLESVVRQMSADDERENPAPPPARR